MNTKDNLKEILKDFDLPTIRKTELNLVNLKWLARNIHFQNKEHPKFKEAIELIKKAIREEIRNEL